MNQSPDRAELPSRTRDPPYANNKAITDSDTTSLIGDDMLSRRCMRRMALKCPWFRRAYADANWASALNALSTRMPSNVSSNTATKCPNSSLPFCACRLSRLDHRLIKAPVTGSKTKAKSVSFQLSAMSVAKLTKIINGDFNKASNEPMTECSTSIKSWVKRLMMSPLLDSESHAKGMDINCS